MSEKLNIDLSESDLGMAFKEWEILSLETLWENPDHMFSSLEVTEAVNEKLSERGDSISRLR